MTIKIDFDNTMEKAELANKCLRDCMPCLARISAGTKGFHVLKRDSDDLKLQEQYDDPTRTLINKFRRESGLTSNFLYDVKWYGDIRKVAGEWQKIESEKDIKKFLSYWMC